MKNKQGRPPHDDILTPAEWRVLDACRHGLSNSAIADSLKVSINAIKYHLKNILAKTGLPNKKSLRNYTTQAKGKREAMTDKQALLAINGMAQISRSVENIEVSKNWYEIVLELPLLFCFDKMAFFQCDGTRLMLVQKGTQTETESIIYFSVSDIFSAYDQLANKGVDCIAAPHKVHVHNDGTEEWMAFFNDLEGRPLALAAQVKKSSLC
ncbi:LuxR C-terminal-related transcriptional regulator [Agaribacter flavus]|uniref:LuxR C-terminal-related transcriptional regulator n=1 Tax=Agaribacter flavus TaxID=1902781 RepID=A0ABV7FQL1_9ALTE